MSTRRVIAVTSRRVFVSWLLAALLLGVPAEAATRLKNICRVKGQEANTLQGLGIVVGLNGTGDGGKFAPTIRSLQRAMQLMGNPVIDPAELKEGKNVALVMVTATIPASGGREGDQLDCVVSSIGAAKSLAGGRLFLTPLQGPQPPQQPAQPGGAPPGMPVVPQAEQARIYALAQGMVHIDDLRMPTSGRVHGGCRLEEDFLNVFSKDDAITLVLDKHHADFEVAQEVAELINSQLLSLQTGDRYLARALDAVNVQVKIPPYYRDDPVLFVSQVLALSITEPPTDARVVINERSGSVVIGADVEIGAAVITHKNIVIETGNNAPGGRFFALDAGQTQTARLKALVEALNGLKVPPEDVIEIIKGLDRNGKLHGRLIIE